jgi:uncharacterized Zn ribbon protein
MTQKDLPSSEGFDETVLRGDVVITEACPKCKAKFAYPTGDCLTCGDCYTEFSPEGPE